jgi:hypothetical protein
MIPFVAMGDSPGPSALSTFYDLVFGNGEAAAPTCATVGDPAVETAS